MSMEDSVSFWNCLYIHTYHSNKHYKRLFLGIVGEKLKEAETAAAQYALHDLWKVSYETRPATLPDEVKELCPKTPSNKDKTAGESNISLEELYANYRKTAAVQLPKKVVQELPKNPMKLDPKSLVYQMKLDSFNSYKVPCLDGRSTVGFKCVLTFIDSNSTMRQFEGYGRYLGSVNQ